MLVFMSYWIWKGIKLMYLCQYIVLKFLALSAAYYEWALLSCGTPENAPSIINDIRWMMCISAAALVVSGWDQCWSENVIRPTRMMYVTVLPSHTYMGLFREVGCLITWFCYQLIEKSGNKKATPSWLTHMYLFINRHQAHIILSIRYKIPV